LLLQAACPAARVVVGGGGGGYLEREYRIIFAKIRPLKLPARLIAQDMYL
jgi:hypothetical protein